MPYVTTLGNLPTMSDVQLQELFRNTARIAAVGGPQKAEADQIIAAIGAEWRKRLQEISAKPNGRRRNEFPPLGMLRALGYRVGKGPENRAMRRFVLDYIVTRELPFVDSLAYLEEWGATRSPERLRKLTNTIASFIGAAKDRPNMARAVADWSEDLDYLAEEWWPDVMAA